MGTQEVLSNRPSRGYVSGVLKVLSARFLLLFAFPRQGSGKTLSFGIPIVHRLCQLADAWRAKAESRREKKALTQTTDEQDQDEDGEVMGFTICVSIVWLGLLLTRAG